MGTGCESQVTVIKKKKIRVKGSSINDVFKEGGGGLGLLGFGKNRLNYGETRMLKRKVHEWVKNVWTSTHTKNNLYTHVFTDLLLTSHCTKNEVFH